MASAPGRKFASPEAYTPRHLAERILTSRSAIEGERKLVTVLFCDLANSTALADRVGPEAMHSLLNHFFELALAEIHRYEGTINQFLGDGFMALFGAPLAHEDHARRAVLAALGIQRTLRERDAELGQPHGVELALRMGLNTGPVVVGKIGDNLRMDYTAVGDTTNLAARLQQLAEPGSILVSQATGEQVMGHVRLDVLPPVAVKGKSDPVAPRKVLGLAARQSPLEARDDRVLSRFVGRDREVGALLDLLAQVEAGQGQAVGVVGEPGVGKSRLFYEFRRRLAGRRITCLEGRCLSYGAAVPYVPILDIVRNNCGVTDTDTPDVIAGKVRLGMQAIGMDPDERAPYLLLLLGVKEGTEHLAVLTPEAIRTRTFDTLLRMSLDGSRRRPLVFVVEDLHWIDTTSEEFLASLVEDLPGAPILLLASYRPGYRPPWTDKSYATQLALRPLSGSDSMNLVHSAAGVAPLGDDLVRLILDKAGGNPFFLEELTRVAGERDDLQSPANVPDTIQAVLMARIDRLHDDPKRVLQTAAVLGREFSARLLEAIWDGPRGLDQHLRELRRLEFLYERSGVDEPTLVFKHALTQDVAYGALLTPHRQALHAAAGRALETLYADRLDQVCDRLAHHYSRTTEAAKAVAYLDRFAARAARAHAHVEAVTAFREALAHLERLPAEEQDRAALDLVLRQAESLHYLGRRQEIVDLLLAHQERLVRLADPSLAGPFYFRLGWTYSFLGDRENADPNVLRAFAAAKECDDQVTMGKASILAAAERVWSGHAVEGLELGRRAVTLLEGTEERWWLAYADYVLAWILVIAGDFDPALEAAARVDAIGETIGDRRLRATATSMTGMVYLHTGEYDSAIEAHRRGLDLSPDQYETALFLGFLGGSYLHKGDLAQAIRVLEEAVPQAKRYRSRQVQAWFTCFLADAYLLDRRLEAAGALATEALQVAGAAKFQEVVGYAQRILGRLAQSRGDFDEARSRLDEALQTVLSTRSRYWTAQGQLALAALAHVQGEQETATAHLAEARALFKAVRVPRWVERTEQFAREFGAALPSDVRLGSMES